MSIMSKTGKCIFCDMLEHELAAEKRIIFRNEYFTVFLPFFCEYPYGVYIFPNRHVPYMTDLNEEERFRPRRYHPRYCGDVLTIFFGLSVPLHDVHA